MQNRKETIVDILGLSPMQEGILYNSLRNMGHDPGFLQISCTLTGELDPGLFREACQVVTRRHSALRTSIHWEGLDAPVQMIHKDVEISLDVQDLRDAELDEAHLLEEILRSDREKGLQLTDAPVNRFGLYRRDRHRWWFVWSCHHVLLDGWSGGLVINEIVETHDRLRHGADLEVRPGFSHAEHVRRLREEPDGDAIAFWSRELDGFRAATPMPCERPDGRGSTAIKDVGRVSVRVSEAETRELKSALRNARVTMGAAIQAVWAALLSAHSGASDVAFGVTDSGRSGDDSRLASAVGLFINTFPVRISIDPDEPFSTLATRLLARRAAAEQHAHIHPERMRSCASLASNDRLYESLVVVQNFPGTASSGVHGSRLAVSRVRGGITSNYPLTLVALPDDELSLHALYDESRFARQNIERLLGDLRTMLLFTALDPRVTVGTLTASLVSAGAVNHRLNDAPRVRRRTANVRYAPPASMLETQLVQIWSRILNLDTVGIDDDFFDIGGHSMLVLDLVAEIETVLGKRLPIVTLVRQSTVRKLAAALADEGWTPPWSSLVPMQPEGTVTPLFCIHSWSGNVLTYRRLARELSPDVPVFGVQAAGFDTARTLHNSVEEMADHYLSEMRSVRPHGPYALLGFCFSVSVASEMTRRLRANGEVVTLFIVDMPPRFEKDFGFYLERAILHVRENGIFGLLKKKVGWWMEKLRRKYEAGPDANHVLSSLSRVDEANQEAWARYSFPSIPGSITYIESSERAGQYRRAHHVRKWKELVEGEVVVRTVKGTHGLLFDEPAVSALADEIRRSLSAVPRQSEPDKPSREAQRDGTVMTDTREVSISR